MNGNLQSVSAHDTISPKNLLWAGCLLLSAVVCKAQQSDSLPEGLKPYFAPPPAYASIPSTFADPLVFYNGSKVVTKEDWRKRREEILARWHGMMGKWPALIEHPVSEILDSVRRENFIQYKIRFNWRPDETTTGYLLIPDGGGKRPAVLTVFYEPETSIGSKRPTIAYAYELAKRGFVTLSVGTNYIAKKKPFAQYYPNYRHATVQPLSMLAYLAANSYNLLADRPEVDPSRVGIIGVSYGSKWTMFASCLYEKFACAVWSDGGIVFDDRRSNVNYWDPWYLGYRRPPWRGKKHRGLYPQLRKNGYDLTDLHVLMAPRPFLVSGGSEDSVDRWSALNVSVRVNKFLGFENRVGMTNRKEHIPDDKSNEAVWLFFDHFLNKE